jgi:hypothetical protein
LDVREGAITGRVTDICARITVVCRQTHSLIPVIHTLFDAAALARHISGEFEIGVIEDCRLWRSFINDVYRLEAGGRRWWLRIHPSDRRLFRLCVAHFVRDMR